MFNVEFPKMKINLVRIAGNATTAFFTVLGASYGAGISEPTAFNAALIGAIIQGGLAAAQELKQEAETESEIPKRVINGDKKKRQVYLLF